MKKLLIMTLIGLSLTSCGTKVDNEYGDPDDIKKELLNQNNSNKDTYVDSQNGQAISNQNNTNNQPPQIDPTVSSLSSSTPLIEITNLNEFDPYNSGEFRIKGKTLGNVDKIVVDFSNKTSSYPDDTYELREFKSGNSTFRYLASSKYSTLDYGLNTYVFTAYSGNEIYRLKVEIDVPDENSTGNKPNVKSGELDEKIDYVNSVGDISTVKKDVSEINCENLTDYLIDNFGYIYRSKCTEVVKDEVLSYNVLRLSGDNFYFEKHYVNYKTGEYSILPLAAGNGVNKENISDQISVFTNMEWERATETDKKFKN